MTIMQHEVEIAGTPDAVLAYACSAGRWPEWHPSSLRVYGPDGPLPAGAVFEEDILAGGRNGHLCWEVLDYVPGQRWRARATGTHALQLLLTYECKPARTGTLFVRTLDYQFPGLLMRLANLLILRRRINRESAESLRILKRVAESLLESGR